MMTSKLIRRLTTLLTIATLVIGCSIALDTESLIQPCQIDAECDEGYFCSSGACLPGERNEQNLPDPIVFDGGVIEVDAGM